MLETLVTIAVVHWLVLMSPGPNVLVVSTLAAQGMRKQAYLAALGVTVMAGLWAIAAALGVSTVFTAHPYLRGFIQLAGGCYLLNMAFRLWRSAPQNPTVTIPTLGSWAAFRTGFMTNALNPKAALFFGSLFTTALPSRPSTFEMVAIISLIVFNALLWHLFLALAFSNSRIQAAYARQRVTFTKLASVMVGLFGVALLRGAVSTLFFNRS